MKDIPRISVVTPSYQQGNFLPRAIESVCAQRYPNVEHIIIDGGSTDSSIEVIQKFSSALAYWHSRPDQGQVDAINQGFARATGDIFVWINADDFFFDAAFKKIAQAYDAAPAGQEAWFGGVRHLDERGRFLLDRYPGRVDVQGFLRWRDNWVTQPACFFSRRAWQQCGPLRSDLEYTMDYELWFSIAERFTIGVVDDLLAGTTIHPDAKTTRNHGMIFGEIAMSMFRHGYPKEACTFVAEAINVLENYSETYQERYAILRGNTSKKKKLNYFLRSLLCLQGRI